ncbi:helix-turn-helix domain-containing protein [Streptomyces iranensis]|uniref:DNA-binding HxlR family transcriptional regulator n=1 Tax=Streptomyces iranensis TaxID=576784 RepID=A0A060ZKX4_9ACTN|nr:DNA-binding HxlR family transcriptional regulator [Streptomyces iranensis]CDR06409.1 transcriptional regulator, HxlR family [Streptomyces iranensis]
MREEPRSGCAINAAVEALGDPWTLIVLRDVIFGGRRHFRDLLTRNDEGIASNVLASRLRKLVEGGLLTRDGATRGQKATYTLTEAGIQTLPVMVALGAWGLRHRPTTSELAVRARLLAEGSPDLVEELMDELREIHLGVMRESPKSPTASERLQRAYEAAIATATADSAPKGRGAVSICGSAAGRDQPRGRRSRSTAGQGTSSEAPSAR